ncbi:MAG: response regulator [Alphaproteobacteria bacterium]|nr:response regulator [Alphaproteobacteria bacterium]MBV9251202.1 response regulator [Acetobacteraceae bacterium]MBV9376487.1 response regulator [Alphaproteobacteria bacterium]
MSDVWKRIAGSRFFTRNGTGLYERLTPYLYLRVDNLDEADAVECCRQIAGGWSAAVLPSAEIGGAANGPPSLEKPAPPPGPGALRILVVDDEASVRVVTAEQLIALGYDVLQAGGGAAALTLLDEGETVDLLISDLSMPEMDGVALIHTVQRRHPRLPTILLTGSGYVGEIAALTIGKEVGEGCFSLLRKPVSSAQLGDCVAMLLDAKAGRGFVRKHAQPDTLQAVFRDHAALIRACDRQHGYRLESR